MLSNFVSNFLPVSARHGRRRAASSALQNFFTENRQSVLLLIATNQFADIFAGAAVAAFNDPRLHEFCASGTAMFVVSIAEPSLADVYRASASQFLRSFGERGSNSPCSSRSSPKSVARAVGLFNKIRPRHIGRLPRLVAGT